MASVFILGSDWFRGIGVLMCDWLLSPASDIGGKQLGKLGTNGNHSSKTKMAAEN